MGSMTHPRLTQRECDLIKHSQSRGLRGSILHDAGYQETTGLLGNKIVLCVNLGILCVNLLNAIGSMVPGISNKITKIRSTKPDKMNFVIIQIQGNFILFFKKYI